MYFDYYYKILYLYSFLAITSNKMLLDRYKGTLSEENNLLKSLTQKT